MDTLGFNVFACPSYEYPCPTPHPQELQQLQIWKIVKYGKATIDWWFGVQPVWVIVSKENNLVNVNTKDFLPNISKMLLFKHETEGRSTVYTNSGLIRVSRQECSLQQTYIYS